MGLRRRALFIIPFIPIMLFIFMGGWVLYWMGKRLNSARELAVTESSETCEGVEVGLIEELMEQQLKDK